MVERATWQGEPERIDLVLAELGLARSRNHAAQLVTDERVRLKNKIAKKASTRVGTGDKLTILGKDSYVSRAAKKLVHALDSFELSIDGKVALDIGASTGGFTQVLLERGAKHVIALDVGHDQLVPEIREDPRVSVVEGYNARYLDRDSLRAKLGVNDKGNDEHKGNHKDEDEVTDLDIDVIVGDVSFISLSMILPAMRNISTESTQAAMLIKPQFEVAREYLSNGIVRDPTAHAAAIHRVFLAAQEAGFTPKQLTRSPIVGQHGNREYLVHLVSNATPNQAAWDDMITQLIFAPDEGGSR